MRIRIIALIVALVTSALSTTIPVPAHPSLVHAASNVACATLPGYTTGFPDTSCLKLNGNDNNTTVNSGTPTLTALHALRLTDGNVNTFESRNAYYTTPLNVTSGFTTQFTFNLSFNNGGGDGFAFIIQNDTAGLNAISGTGGGFSDSWCANGTCSGVNPGIAIEFDAFNNAGDQIISDAACDGSNGSLNTGGQHVAVFLNGDVTTEAAPSCVSLLGQHTATLTYNPNVNPSLMLSLDGTQALRYNADLPTLLGASTGYVGFGAATGSFADTVDILNWSVERPTNIVKNGSFESPSAAPGVWSQSTPIDNWSVCAGSSIEIGNNWVGSAEDGSQYVELNSDAPAGICQSISTVAGQTYQLSFWYSARDGSPSSANQMTVTWDGTQQGSTITADGTGLSNTSWKQYSFTVTATSNSTILKFVDVGDSSTTGCGSCGSLLDNVQVQAAPAFSPSPDGKYTNEGTPNNPLGLSGTADPDSSITLYDAATPVGCGSSVTTVQADGSGKWSATLTNVSEGVHYYSAKASNSTYDLLCSKIAKLTVDRVTPTSTIAFPTVLSSNTATAWNNGCHPAGVCGSASDPASGIQAVYVLVKSGSGGYWNGTSFTSTKEWVKATPTSVVEGTTNWNLPMAVPGDITEGTYTIVSAAVDNAGNAEQVLLETTTPCSASGGGVTYSAGGGVTYSAGGGVTYSAGGDSGTCPSNVSGGVTYSAGGGGTGGGVTYSAGGYATTSTTASGGVTYSAGGGSGCSGSGTGGGVTFSAGGGVTYSAGGGVTYSAGGVSGTCNMMTTIIDSTPPAISFVQAGDQTISDGFVNVNPVSTIHVIFNEGMAATATPATTTTPATAVINGSVSLTPSVGTSGAATCGTDLTCENVSLSHLAPSTAYTLTVSGVTDWAGNAMPSATYHFMTAANGTLNTADNDHDGIPEVWETPPTAGGTGTPINVTLGGTTQPVSLTSWGFTPGTQDLCLVENYMNGMASDGKPYNQAISQAANQAIVNAFAAKSIHLVIFEGDAAHSAGLPIGYGGPYYGGSISMVDPLGSTATGAFGWSSTFTPTTNHPNATSPQQSYDQIRSANFASTGLSQVCHYAVIAHQIGDSYSSGSARGFGSSDLVVALGTTATGIGSQAEQQGTVMHELGHNLGLQHGGGDGVNNKPDYPSVMNYSFQFSGVVGGSAPYGLDYSNGSLSPLDEDSLNDTLGLGLGSSVFGTRYFCGSSRSATTVIGPTSSINWGCNATGPVTGTHSGDINGDGVYEGSAHGNPPLKDYNDWAHLNFLGGVIGLGAVSPPEPASTIDVSGAASGGVDSPTAVESKSGLYTWIGFLAPLDPDYMGNVLNTGKSGKTYPVKFQLKDTSGNFITSLSAVKSIMYSPLSSCTAGTSDPIDYDVAATSSALRYDSTANQFIYNWQTPGAGCYMLKVSLADGTAKLAKFKLS